MHVAKKKTTLLYISLVSLLFSGCGHYVEVKRQKINAGYLASTSVGSPDPRQENPPLGEMLIIDWQVPLHLITKNPKLKLYVIYWDNEESEYAWPLKRWKGYRTFSVLNEEFVHTGGLLTYRAEIVTEDGKVYREWKHQLWVNLIKMDGNTPETDTFHHPEESPYLQESDDSSQIPETDTSLDTFSEEQPLTPETEPGET